MIFNEQGEPQRFEIFTDESGYQYTADFFVYPFAIGTLAAGATQTTNVTVEANSYFEWQASTIYANKDGATTPISDASLIPVTLQIMDTGAGRNLFYAPVPVGSIAGLGKLPFYLPQTRLFMAKAQITLFSKNFDGTDQYDNITFSMIGRKIFPLGKRIPGRGP